MDSFLPADLGRIAQELQVKRTTVEAFAELRAAGATIPFIARYRKAKTDALPDEALRALDHKLHNARRMTERRQGLVRLAEEMGRADDAFKTALDAAATHADLDDLAGMLHPRRMGYGDSARSVGLEPLADAIWRQDPQGLVADPAETLAGMIDAEKGLGTVEDVQRGIGMILAERLARYAAARQACRPIVWAGKFVSRPAPGAVETKLAADFKAFANYGEPCRQAAPQRVVAVNRGDRLGALVVGIEFDRDAFEKAARAAWPFEGHKFAAALKAAAPEGLALLATDLEQEIRREISEIAEEHLVKLLQRTVHNLLMQPGLPATPILAIDPGVRLGVRWAALDANGEVAGHGALGTMGGPVARRKKKRKRSDTIASPEQQTDWAARKMAEVDAAARGELPPLAAAEPAAPPPPRAPREPVPPRPPAAPIMPPPPALPADSFYRSTAPGDAGEGGGAAAEAADEIVVEPAFAHAELADAEPEAATAGADDGEGGAGDEQQEGEGHDGEGQEGDAGGPPQPSRRERAKALFKELLTTHGIRHIALGGGPGCHEVEDILGELVLEGVELVYAVVPDAAAGAYANGGLAREELPDLDPGARRAVSIGRRLRDPLQELVKIDPVQWGLGPLQGDIAPRLLRQRLEEAIDATLHEVGLDAGTTGFAALRRLAGMDDQRAKNLLASRAKRPFANRLAVQEAAEMEDAAFAQSAGFLRVTGGDQPLDSTWIHPENYPLAEQLLTEVGGHAKQLGDPQAWPEIAVRLDAADAPALAAKYATDVPTVWDTLDYLARPGADPRLARPAPPLFAAPRRLETLEPGQHLRGTALNVVDFGVFVDIGLREGGLVHLSEMANRFVASPHEVVSVGDVLDVWVLKVDAERKRVSLTLIAPEQRRGPGERRGGRPPRGEGRPQQGGGGDRRPQRFDDQRQGPPRGGDDRGPPRRQQGGRPQQGGGRPPREFQPREYTSAPKPKPTPKLTTEKLEGRSVLHGFGELKAFFAAKKDTPSEPPAHPPETPPAAE